jgi:tetratricopeptide (TPR) repeat protein
MLLYLQKRFPEAEALYRRSLAIWESSMGARDPALATTLDNLAVVYASQEKFAEAEPLYLRSLALRQKEAVESLNNLALVLEGRSEDAAAERYYRQAVNLAGTLPEPPGESVGKHELLAKTLENYATLLRKLKRPLEAAKMEARARTIGKPKKKAGL